MAFEKITEKELRDNGVVALADKPNVLSQIAQRYGRSGLTAAQLKAHFDKSAKLLADKFNALIDILESEDATKYLGMSKGFMGTDSNLYSVLEDLRSYAYDFYYGNKLFYAIKDRVFTGLDYQYYPTGSLMLLKDGESVYAFIITGNNVYTAPTDAIVVTSTEFKNASFEANQVYFISNKRLVLFSLGRIDEGRITELANAIAELKTSDHDTSGEAHGDIRELIAKALDALEAHKSSGEAHSDIRDLLTAHNESEEAHSYIRGLVELAQAKAVSAYNLASGKSRVHPVVNIKGMYTLLQDSLDSVNEGDVIVIAEPLVPEFILYAKDGNGATDVLVPSAEASVEYEAGKIYYLLWLDVRILALESGIDTSKLATKEELENAEANAIETANAYTDNAILTATAPKSFELINTITVAPDTDGNLPNSVIISVDENGLAFEITDFYIRAECAITAGNIKANVNNTASLFGNIAIGMMSNTSLRKWALEYHTYGEDLGGYSMFPNTTIATTANYPNSNISNWYIVRVPPKLDSSNYQYNTINSITISCTDASGTFIDGSTFELWGVRK